VKHNWPEILAAQIESMDGVPFEWGKTDCCMFAANVVEEMTGIDYAKEFRGKYKTMKGAIRALKRKGLDEVMDGKFKRTDFPKRGDVVLINKEITEQPIPALGICIGMQIALMGDDGLEFLPIGMEAAAWDVHNG